MDKEICRRALSFFQRPLAEMRGVGPQVQGCFERLGLKTVRDLLWHRPLGVEVFPRLPLAEVRVDMACTVGVQIVESHLSPKSLRLVVAEPGSPSAPLQIVFFKGPLKQFRSFFAPGTRWFFSGKLSLFDGVLTLVHPVRWNSFSKGPPSAFNVIYPLTKGLSVRRLQSVTEQALQECAQVPEWLPRSLLEAEGWSAFPDALRMLHSPRSEQDVSSETACRRRLAFDELLAHQMALLGARQMRQKNKAPSLRATGTIENLLRAKAGFSLTYCQAQALKEILKDLEQETPMARLLQGDVGSGKTIVAFLALARALENNYQGVFLAPTEILAHQQAEKMAHLLEGAGVKVALLTRSTPKRSKVLADIASGKIGLVVGTHAVLQEAVTFHRLALVVIDEQHRFGVEQRLRLTQKGQAPHLLVMSATPIPRTLEMTLFADLDLSTIREKPPGRTPPETRVLSSQRGEELEAFVAQKLQEGAQVYWVCPLIEEKEEPSPQARASLPSVLKRFERLQALFPGRVGLVHGQQKAELKQSILDAFRVKQLQILVSTTVIEVGVDVPDATLMVIEGAQQFGLAQLHQLRGRVGRGREKSFCFLIYGYPLSDVARQRLEILRKSTDGFWIAEQDWRLRGGGDLLGVRQSGLPLFAFADLEVHGPLLTQAHTLAQEILKEDPCLQGGERSYALRLMLKLFQGDQGGQVLFKAA